MFDLETIGKWAAVIISVLTILTIVGKFAVKYIHFRDCGRLKEENETLVKISEAKDRLLEMKDKALAEVNKALTLPQADAVKQTKEAMNKLYRDTARMKNAPHNRR